MTRPMTGRTTHAFAPSILGLALVASVLAGCSGKPAAPRTDGDVGRAQQLLAAGKKQEGLRELAAVRPASAEQWRALAAAWARLPGYERYAADALAPAIATGDPELVVVAARALIGADRLGEAEKALKGVLAAHPEAQEAAAEYAKLLGRLGRHTEAVGLLAPRAGNDPRMLNLLGYAELLAGRLEEGRGHLERSVAEAVSRGKDYAPPHYHLGLYWRAQNDLARAVEEFRKTVAINANHLEAHYQWMAAAEALGRPDEAAQARAGFARLYRERLTPLGLFDDLPPSTEVDRGADVESRPLVKGAQFVRELPAGAMVEFGCLAPKGARARFTVTVNGGATMLDAVHEGEPGRGVWIPHRVELPAGAAGAKVKLVFDVRAAGRFAGLFGGTPPEGAAFSEPGVLGDPAARSKDPRPNIVLVSLDTLRADRLGAYGSGRPNSPVIDRLAAGGARFARAQAASTWTLPSHYSMFSGLTPAAHGVLPDLGLAQGYIFPDSRLAVRGTGREVMLAEALADAGYRTAAVTEDGWVSPRFGFDQGFRVFRAALEGSLPATTAGTLAELETSGTRGPWFLFVHTYAPHQPYHAPRPLRTRFAAAGHEGFSLPAARVPMEDYYRFRGKLFPPAASDVKTFRDLYDGQVLWSDGLIGEIVTFLEEKGLAEQTIVAITSDHGEELFERGQFDHGDTLFEEATHVPLILYAPGRIPAGRVVDGAISQVDLPATLLDLAGLGDRHGQGRSLRPLWEGQEPAGQRRAFAEVIGHGAEPLSAAWAWPWKLIRRETKASGVKEWLFDLAADPQEQRDLSASRATDLARLRALLAEHGKTAAGIRAALGASEETLDEETLGKLRSLGYVK